MRGGSLWLVLVAGCSFEHGLLPGAGSDGSVIDVPDGSGSGSDTSGPTLRQKTITIGSGVSGTLTDFPLWISLTDADLGARARPDGTDIHFVALAGTPLDYEIQAWTKSDGHLEAWVRMPAITAGAQLAVRYGDVSLAHAPNPVQTFTGYAAVWHFEDTLSGTTITDARNQHTGTASMLGTADSVTAKLGRGIDFKGGDQQVTFTNPLAGNTPHTISVWINQRTTNDNDAIIAMGNAALNQARWFHSRYDGSTIAVGFYTNDYANPGENIIGGNWTLLHWVFEGNNRNSRIYRDGALVAGPYQHNSGINTQGTDGFIGNAPTLFGTNMGLNATLDEVRIIDVARSAAWIAAEAANQSNPSAFYTVSAEQTP